MDDCIRLKVAGYTEHEIAQAAKVPTPTIVVLARYGRQPLAPIEGVDVEALLKAKKPEKTEEKQPEKAEEKAGETPKTEGKGK